MKIKTIVSISIIFIFFTFILGCGPKPIQKESVLDTPENHFNQGMRELNDGNYNEAMREFERAKALDPKYAEAYSGMGLVMAYQGDFEKAMQFAKEGLDRNDKSVDCHVIAGRILVAERKGDDWIKKAVKQFDKAIELNPNSDKAYYYKGLGLKNAYLFADATAAFSKAVELKGDFGEGVLYVSA